MQVLANVARALLLSALFGVPAGKILYELTGVLGLSLLVAGIMSALAMQSRLFVFGKNKPVAQA